MATVFVSAILRPLIAVERVEVPGTTVGEVIGGLESLHPGAAEILVEDGEIRAGIAVAINDQMGQMGLYDAVPENADVHFLPALSGG